MWAARGCDNLDVVPNGIDTQAWHPVEHHDDYLSWVGRITPNKGLAEAVKAARKAKARLRIFGPVEDVPYFTEHVSPFLGDGIDYLGHASAQTLREEVAGAKAAIVTPMWDEPFGLVAAEALACGTPVVGFDRGALREVVGDCGLLVKCGDVGALAQAIGKVGRIDRAACRQHSEEKLSIAAMIAGYEACYTKVIAGARRSSLSRLAWSSSWPSTRALLA